MDLAGTDEVKRMFSALSDAGKREQEFKSEVQHLHEVRSLLVFCIVPETVY